MKLLLDEMLSGAIASALNLRGIDTVAAQDQEDLRQLDDDAIFAVAQQGQQAVVTYNRNDLLSIYDAYGQRLEEHHGLIILNSRCFPQRHSATRGRIVIGLAQLAGTEPGPSFLHWLQ